MATEAFTVEGAVLSRFGGTGVGNLRVEAWDRDHGINDPLGVAPTDDKGRFEIEIDRRYYKEIEERKPDISFRVFTGKDLIHSTEDSVLWNIQQPHLQVTISVDLLPGAEDRNQPKSFIVRGRVAQPDGAPLAGLWVVTVERDARRQEPQGERLLGTAKTDKGGYYAIHYTADDLANPAKGSADLMVKVYADGSHEPRASSPLILNALEEEIINLSVGEEPYRGRSEYAVVAERLLPLLERANNAEFSHQDLAYFSNQTGLTLEQVQLYAESRKQAPKAMLDGAVLYGLYRTGMPYSLAALTVQNTEALHASLKRAQQKNIIAPLAEAAVVGVVASLQALSSGSGLEGLRGVEGISATRRHRRSRSGAWGHPRREAGQLRPYS